MIIFGFVFFLFIALLFSHWFLYISFVRFFAIEKNTVKILLIIILFVLGASFFISSALAHFHENVFTKNFYFLSSFWLGMLIHLLLMLTLCWICVWTLHVMGKKPNVAWVATGSIILAVCLSVYATWNAFHPVIKEITVHISNLPDAWQNKKIVHLSDVHLGHIYDANFLRTIIEQVNGIYPDMVVMTGDLFDGMDGSLQTLIEPLHTLQAPQGIYYVIGNHEIYLGIDTILTAFRDTGVTMLRNEMISVEGLQVVGLDYPPLGRREDIKTVMSRTRDFDASKPSILLYHEPTYVEQAKEEGFNLMLSGHTHRGQIFPFEFLTFLIYGDYYYGLHQDGNFSLYTSCGVGAWGTPMRTGNSPEIVVITLQK